MAVDNKDFRVKNGIQVAGDATVVGTISAASPTEDGHVVTKSYLNQVGAKAVPSSSAPSPASNGQLWFDTVKQRVNVYFSGIWITLATISDAAELQEHIHDTSIDGNGLISTLFINGGDVLSPQGYSVTGGNASTTDWEETWSGGFVTDNFN